MIFNTSEDIKRDVKSKISNYLKETIGNNSSIDTNNIISLLRCYFYELKIRDELIDSNVSDDKSNYIINIKYQRLNEIITFDVDLYSELRKLKIVKIQKHDIEKKNFKNFFI